MKTQKEVRKVSGVAVNDYDCIVSGVLRVYPVHATKVLFSAAIAISGTMLVLALNLRVD